MRTLHVGLAATLVTAFVGCGGGDQWTAKQPATVEARGVVTLDGNPVDGASLFIAPIEGGHAAKAMTNSDGSFSLDAFSSKEGAVPGKYKVGISKTVEASGATADFDPGEDAEHAQESGNTSGATWINILPTKYANPMTSGLTAEIPSGGVTDLKIELVGD